MPEIVMPRLSDSMEEGTILTWMKQVGEEVAVGEEIVEIETDKANMAYESDVAGTLTGILAKEGETLPIGAPIAVVGDPGEAPTRVEEAPAAATSEAAEAETVHEVPVPGPRPATPAPAPAPASEERVRASPLARRVAREQGVDLGGIQGSGPGGRIVKADVERADGTPPREPLAPAVPAGAPAAETAKGRTEVVEPTRLQQVIARRMAESKATAPHFYLETEVDMSAAVGARARIRARAPEGEVVPSFNDMVVKACAIALRSFPYANGAYRDGRFELHSRVNVGVAVAAEGSLVVPTVFDADRKG
ncbi:MAG: 2-oxo acid dehydrogenase subunit E2, partial [Actinobacteria bacterium]|nr:2-oxo acid dehydrogenase subunit E2 [Actinomycetota bacterium]